jgi:hypothetical protein
MSDGTSCASSVCVVPSMTTTSRVGPRPTRSRTIGSPRNWPSKRFASSWRTTGRLQRPGCGPPPAYLRVSRPSGGGSAAFELRPGWPAVLRPQNQGAQPFVEVRWSMGVGLGSVSQSSAQVRANCCHVLSARRHGVEPRAIPCDGTSTVGCYRPASPGPALRGPGWWARRWSTHLDRDDHWGHTWSVGMIHNSLMAVWRGRVTM